MGSIQTRYGTVLRIYDRPSVADRFTIIPPRWAGKDYEEKPGHWMAIGCDANPFHPLGIGQHCSAIPGPHLGRRITWAELPPDAQKLARQTFPEFAPKG